MTSRRRSPVTTLIPREILEFYYLVNEYSAAQISTVFYGDRYRYKFVLSQLRRNNIPLRRTSRRWVDTGLKQRRSNPELEMRRMSALRLAKQSPEHRDKMREVWQRQEYIDAQRAAWRDDQKTAGRVAKIVKALSRRPTTPEKRIIDIVTKYDLPFKYSGDGTFIIAGLNPDFINTNGEKVALEVFGDHWHSGANMAKNRTESGRKATLAEYGWRLNVIWESEMDNLSDAELAERIAPKGHEYNQRSEIWKLS